MTSWLRFRFENTPERLSAKRPKLVVAHFMLGNTIPFTDKDWVDDIDLASASGIDAFALNIGKEDWQIPQLIKAFNAADSHRSGFKLFLSFDMSALAASTGDDAEHLVGIFRQVATRSSYLSYSGRALVSTFAGERSLFGHSSVELAWAHVKQEFERIRPVCFIPSLFLEPKRILSMPSVDGVFNWNGCWPIHLTPGSPPEEIKNPQFLTDVEYTRWLGKPKSTRKIYMASVSPWFFTHYGKDSWNKNWIYRGDDWLLVRRWQHLISIRDDVDIVQIISWNDYGESHYMGPIKGAQPNSEAWVNGFDHTPWLRLNQYFIEEFKENDKGIPRIPKNTGVYFWARPHARDAKASSDSVGRPDGWQLTEDVAWVVVLSDGAGEIKIHAVSALSEEVVKHRVVSGINLFSYPLIRDMSIVIVYKSAKGGTPVTFCPNFVFKSWAKTYNFNVFVAECPLVDC